MIAAPHNLAVDPAFRPFLDLLEAQFLLSDELARRWRYHPQSVHNMRRLGTGPAFVKLPGGAIRYRVSEVLAYELYGHGGGLTMDRVAVALATCPGLAPAARDKIESHLRSVLCVKVAA
jgi:hypothetical protein